MFLIANLIFASRRVEFKEQYPWRMYQACLCLLTSKRSFVFLSPPLDFYLLILFRVKCCFYFGIVVNSSVSTKQTSLRFRTLQHPFQHEIFHLSLFIRDILCILCTDNDKNINARKRLNEAEVDWIPQISQSTSPGISFNIDMDQISCPSLILLLSF